MRELELYLHIPFCVRKCKYCDFLSFAADERKRREYVESLCRKIRAHGASAKAYHVVSVYLGGGTPSILDAGQTRAIFEAVCDTFAVDADAEITTEANPGTLTEEKLKAYRDLGINRLSIGLQSANNQELRALGRIHTYEDFLETYTMARKAGFENVNIDLMSALPGQTLESFENTLKAAAALEPEHLSVYSLMIEEGTPFYEIYGESRTGTAGYAPLPDEDTEWAMYRRTKEILETYGFYRYEISNYAKAGYECRHNLGYWNRTEYLGIGDGAASLIGNVRWKEGGEREVLSIRAQMEEFMFLGLRKTEGISAGRFYQTFHKKIEEIYGGVIGELCRKELLVRSGDSIRLTERGMDVSNGVLCGFLLN